LIRSKLADLGFDLSKLKVHPQAQVQSPPTFAK
jgi:hypothetical protein